MRGYDVNNEEFLHLPAVLCVIVGPPQLCLETKEHRQASSFSLPSSLSPAPEGTT